MRYCYLLYAYFPQGNFKGGIYQKVRYPLKFSDCKRIG